jgi:hypothetical protein|tara:strand:+ start:1852 stop:2037 length:186 start_codon:yes stop_codon:yes gene_type:complete
MVKLICLNNVYYQLVRSITIEQVDGNMEGLKAWRDRLHCDHVLKHQNQYLMVRKVEDVEVE